MKNSRRKRKTPETYRSLRALWYSKLKKSGFEDIERLDQKLKRYSLEAHYYGNHITWEAKREYYYMANQFLHNYKFESRLQRIVWEYHSNGISIRNIVKLLNKTRIVKTNRDSIWLVVRDLSRIMKKAYLVDDSQ